MANAKVLLILALSAFTAVVANKCFQCNSYSDQGCDTLKSNDTDSEYYKECAETHHGKSTFCRKTMMKVLDPDTPWRVDRSCGYISHWSRKNSDYCLENDSAWKLERSCQCFTDGCNSAPSYFSASSSVVVAAVCSWMALAVAL